MRLASETARAAAASRDKAIARVARATSRASAAP